MGPSVVAEGNLGSACAAACGGCTSGTAAPAVWRPLLAVYTVGPARIELFVSLGLPPSESSAGAAAAP